MLGNKPPYTTMQQLNLDWILSKLKTLLRLVPPDGAVGQILRRTRDGAVWSDEQGGGGGGAVQSVNGQTGAVVLDAADVGALPDDYTPPVTSVNGQTGAVTVSVPVQSVNGKTGEVVLDAAAVGALPNSFPTVQHHVITNTLYMAGTWFLDKSGTIVSLTLVNFTGIPAGRFVLSGIIPEIYRPANEISFTIIKRGTSFACMALSITTTGDVNCYNYGAAQTGAAGWNNVVTWIVEE